MERLGCRKGETITLYCLLGNLVLSLFKGLVGFWGGSKAMIADAFHSGSDSIATMVVYIGLKISRKPADKDHPYGHGKAESLAAAFVGVTMMAAAAMIAREIIYSVIENNIAAPSIVTLVVAAGSIVVKELMFRINYHTGLTLNNEAIIAGAWDHRSDVYSSAAVFFGISGGILGAFLGVSWLKYLDPLAGALVVGLIFNVALKILVKALRSLMDASPAVETISHITCLAEDVSGVNGVSWVRGRVVGARIYIDMAVRVSAEKSVQEGHNIGQFVKEAIRTNVPHIGEVLIHINPHPEEREKSCTKNREQKTDPYKHIAWDKSSE